MYAVLVVIIIGCTGKDISRYPKATDRVFSTKQATLLPGRGLCSYFRIVLQLVIVRKRNVVLRRIFVPRRDEETGGMEETA